MTKKRKSATPMTERDDRRNAALRVMREATDASLDDPKKMARLCRNALKVYPHCPEALIMLAEIESQNDDRYLSTLRRAIAAGREDLGPEYFEQNKGHFWGLLETRPFMRAMGMLADALISQGTTEALEEAITLHEEMLDLNPNDNQGVRDWLAGSYLALKQYDNAAALLDRYDDDWLAAPIWARVLHTYATKGEKQAARHLGEARQRNPHVEAYLTERKNRPSTRPEYYSPGDDSEALYCADMLGQAWQNHPEAKEWLKQAGESKSPPGDSQQTLFDFAATPEGTNDSRSNPDPPGASEASDRGRIIEPKLAIANEDRVDASPQEDPNSDLQSMYDDVPKAYLDRFEDLIRLLDAFCETNLNDEYRDLCREMACSFCQPGSPVRSGKPEGWAAGIVYCIGQVNFLTDPSQTPHMKSAEVASGIGVSVATMRAKAKIIHQAFGDLIQFHPDWTLPSLMDQNPLVWMIEANGLLLDIRAAPREVQRIAYENGLIPYIPADRDDQSEP
jgi:tetratricopeptide (TPR) repeat protein